jgi:CRP-like cAMP-binding protein
MNPYYDRLYNHLKKIVPITEKDVELMMSYAKITKLKKKSFLFQEGEIARHVGFVNQGVLRYYYTDEHGEEHIIYFAQEEWWIGDLNSFYGQVPTPYYLQALENTELFLFTRENFDRVRSSIPAYDEYVKVRHAKATAARLDTMMSLRAEHAEDRYEKLLKSFPDIFQRVPQHYIASYLGIKPQSLSRIRKIISEKNKR